MNLVQQTEKLITPGLVSRLSASLGIAQGPAQRAIKASMSGTLASLTDLAERREGPAALAHVMAAQDPAIMRSYARQVSSSAQPALIEEGADTLGSLFGGHKMAALAGDIGKYSGMPKHRAAAVLGVTAPLVLGQLANLQRRKGLDAQGLAKLLNEQRGDINRALPDGFARLAKRGKSESKSVNGSAQQSSNRGDIASSPASGTRSIATSLSKTFAKPTQQSTWRMMFVGLVLVLSILGLYAASPNGLQMSLPGIAQSK